MPGLPSKYMKNLSKYGGMAGAWKAYRAEQGGGSKGGEKKIFGLTTSKKASKDSYASATLGILADAAFAIAGAAATAAIVHFTPGIKKMPAWARASLQGGLGTLSFFLPWNFARMAGLGAVIVSGTTLINTFTGYSVLAGPGDVLSREAMDELTKGILNGPVQIPGMAGPVYIRQTMNGPVYVPAGNGMSGGSAYAQGQDLQNDPHSWAPSESWGTNWAA